MAYQKIINFLDNKPNQPTKFWTKNWVEINDDARGMYNTNSRIKFKTLILKSSLSDCRDAYILLNGAVRIDGEEMMIIQNDQTKKKRSIIEKVCPIYWLHKWKK